MQHFNFILGEGEEAIVKLVIGVIVFVIWGIGALGNIAKKANQNRTKSPFSPPGPVSSSNVAVRKTLSTAMRPRTLTQAQLRQQASSVPRLPVAAPTPPPAPPLVFDAPPVVLRDANAPMEAILLPQEQDLRDRLIWLEVLGKPLALRGDF